MTSDQCGSGPSSTLWRDPGLLFDVPSSARPHTFFWGERLEHGRRRCAVLFATGDWFGDPSNHDHVHAIIRRFCSFRGIGRNPATGEEVRRHRGEIWADQRSKFSNLLDSYFADGSGLPAWISILRRRKPYATRNAEAGRAVEQVARSPREIGRGERIWEIPVALGGTAVGSLEGSVIEPGTGRVPPIRSVLVCQTVERRFRGSGESLRWPPGRQGGVGWRRVERKRR